MSEERRTTPRYPASLAGELESGAGRTSIAITRDVSSSGLLVLSRHDVAVGTTVSLRVVFKGHDVTVSGKVVRHEEVDPDQSSLWLYKVAVAVDSSPSFDQLMTELARPADPAPAD